MKRKVTGGFSQLGGDWGFGISGANGGFSSNGNSLPPLEAPLNLVATADTDSIGLTWTNQNDLYRTSLHVVGIGSSTMAGSPGPSSFATSYMGLLETALGSLTDSLTFDNAAVGGQDIYELMPSSFTPPVGRPSPNVTGNITYAINEGADIIILHDASNSVASGYTTEEIQGCYQAIYQAAVTAGKTILFVTTQPRTGVIYAKRQQLQTIAYWIANTFPNTIQIFDSLALFTPSDPATDLFILPAYNSGDNLHLNDAGHEVIFDLVYPYFEGILTQTVESNDIYRSLSESSGYSLLASISSTLELYDDLTPDPGVTYYYKVKAIAASGSGYSDSAFSNIDSDVVPESSLLQTVRISFGSTVSGAPTYNDFNNNAVTFNFLNTLGLASGISGISSSFSLTGTNGDSPDGGTGYSFPNAVMTSYFFTAGVARNLTITGNVGKVYRVVILGTRSNQGGAVGPRVTDYTINGVTKTLECFQNKTNVVVFDNVPLNGSNQFVLSVVRNAANITNGYLNAIIIEEYQP